MKNKPRQRKKNLQQNGLNREKESSANDEKGTKNGASLELVIFRTVFAVLLIGLLAYGSYMYGVAKSPDNVKTDRPVAQRENEETFVELDSDTEDIEDESVTKDQHSSSLKTEEIPPVKLSEKSENLPLKSVIESSDNSESKEIKSSTIKTDSGDKPQPNQAQKVVSNKNQNGGKSQKNNKRKAKRSEEDVNDIQKEVEKFKASYLKTMSPKKIFVDGRRLPPVELLPQKPNNSSVRVFLYDEFLSEKECDGLMKAHDSHVKEFSKNSPLICFDTIETLRKHLKAARKKIKVTPADFIPGTFCVNETFSTQLSAWLKSNWSYSTAFYPGESKFSKIFEYRVKEATQLLPENGGKFQITSYPRGIGYKTHTDCIENNADERDRMATILVYLQDVEDGGETKFPELGIWVKPRKGRALVWNNMNEEGRCEPLSVHNAAKVNKGHKYIIQRWYYFKNFYSLGKRPPEPEMPHRAPGTPRVNCDEYEKGSCRWYDEWNYEHLVDYRNQRINLK